MRRAFTILELLAATALTALLMLAVFHVVATLGASRAALARQPDTGAVRADLLDTVRRDLAGATQVSFRTNGMTLTGHGSLDRSTLAARQEPVTVAYDLATLGGRSWLVRRQSSRGGLSNQAGWTELLRPDVARFSVVAAAIVGVASGNSALDSAKQEIPPVLTGRFPDAAGGVDS